MRRSLLRWSLRTALVAVAIAACALGYLAKVRRDRIEQERAIAAIDKMGGMVGSRVGFCMVYPDRRPVVDLTWSGDDDLTDADLVHLAWLPELEYLFLDAPKVTDAGLAHLAALTRLDELALHAPLTDAGLARLRGLTRLTSLNLSETKVTDAGLAHLATMTSLKSIDLPAATTDAGLARLKKMKGLQALDLTGTAVTDAGLEHVKEMTGLTTLWVDSSRISSSAWEDLRKARPDLEIHRD